MQVGIYENVFISNFIYALGLKIGINSCQCENKKGIPSCVNLLQQTPVDKFFGDMLGSFEGISFLIEFKKKESRDNKEMEKRNKLWESIKYNNEMCEISRLAHWFILIDDSTGIETKVVPYLDMLDPNAMAEADSFEHFIEKIVEKIFNYTKSGEIMDVGVLAEPMSAYLTYLKELFSKPSNRRKQYKLGGLIINVTPDGGLKYVVLNDITKVLELNLTISKIRKHGLKKTNDISI